MSKFASALGIGPLYHRKYCFDILVLKDHSEFLMECCEEPKAQNEKARIEQIEEAIRESLAALHSFKAVHMDIKPDNIAYSPHHKKFVLLDFGFAEFLREDVGEKTFITPRGTYFYMNKEMKNASSLDQSSFIDLYDNDLFALKHTFQT